MKTLIRAAVLLVSSLACAQTAPASDVEQLWLDPGGQGSLFVGDGQVLPHAQFRMGLSGLYTHANLRSVSQPSSPILLKHRLGFQLFGALGVFNWLELGANVPVYVFQEGAQALQLASAGLGNPWFQAKVNLLGPAQALSLGIVIAVGIPAGTGAAQGNGGFEFAPRVQLGRIAQTWRFAAEGGYLARSTVDFQSVTLSANDRLGSQLYLGLMASKAGPHGLRGEVSVRGFVPLVAGASGGVEGQLGVRWRVGKTELFAAAGPGIGGQSTPSMRAYLGVAMNNGS